ncbi:hypothetical protein RJ639_008478 [Escallonia herrerae]|uniref:RNA polymerase Rpb1 domain-containing protein n=1 Tax=Escallonia herrerae TaxID=1293975 RepID=A0AA88VSQ6_9ASTE|nr:hypothetical protein RJ639_008478 [Escallonia herrerae]
MDASGTSNSSVVNADGGSSIAGDEDSCSTRAGDAFAFNFGILRMGSGRKEGENQAEFVTLQLFLVDGRGGGGGELTQEKSSRPNWVNLTFGQAGSFGGGLQDLRVLQPPPPSPPQQQQVKKSGRAPRYELDDEKWNPNYMLPEHVEDLKTIREFRNVFDAEVQKLEAYGFQLGTEIATTDLLMEIVEAVDKLQERLKVVTGDDAMSMETQKNATFFFNILLRSTFASKRVLNDYRLTREPFDWVIVR